MRCEKRAYQYVIIMPSSSFGTHSANICVAILMTIIPSVWHFEVFEEICRQQDDNMRRGKQMRIRADVEEGDAVEFPCKFCRHPKDPVKWYSLEHAGLLVDGRVVKHAPVETEVTADPFTFDEFNRVYVNTENTLVIRKFNESDLKMYYCRHSETGDLNGFEHDPQLILRHNPHRFPVNQSLFLQKVEGLKMQIMLADFRIDLLSISLLQKPWSECNSCGDLPGEQERALECRVRISKSLKRMLPENRLSPHERTKLESQIKDYMTFLYPDYESYSDLDLSDDICLGYPGLEACQKRMERENPGWFKGISCQNALYLRRWKEFSQHFGTKRFPPDLLARNVIETKTCQLSCENLATKTGSSKNTTSKSWFRKLLKLRGINLLKIFRRQKKRLKHKAFKRHVLSEYAGTGIKLGCPGATLDHLVLWKNGTYDLNPFTVAADSAGRITYVTTLVLHIRNLSTYDAQLYSCWQDNSLKGEVQIKVVKRKPPPPDMRISLLYLAVGTAVDVIIFVALMIVWRRQETQSKMKDHVYRNIFGPNKS
ncbi:uncharacterized protein LOC129595150 [Paramacrobiotus metropolitanus]|uniref:uncharacterized protein LOC129595150 n=1 Tax=Paramacrobiotus metropolitanus TaxID=2943436 RepID=UPI00244604B0|nr:uncharacterized protein LOC129595150 [Paramacrobiotus metropolitanus]